MPTTLKDEGPVVGVCWEEGGALPSTFGRAQLTDPQAVEGQQARAGVGVPAAALGGIKPVGQLMARQSVGGRLGGLAWSAGTVDGVGGQLSLDHGPPVEAGQSGDALTSGSPPGITRLRLRTSTTKGYKPAVVALAPRTVQAVGLAVAHRRSRALLLNRHGGRMTPYNVQYLVKALCHGIDVDRRSTPHSLRHSAITMALDAGIGLRDVQDFARHEDPKTTRRHSRSRNQLNRHATYAIAQYLAGGN